MYFMFFDFKKIPETKKEEVLDLMDELDKLHKQVILTPERIEKLKKMHKDFEAKAEQAKLDNVRQYELALRMIEVDAIRKEINLLNLWK